MKKRMIQVLLIMPLVLLMPSTVLADESGGQCENDTDCPQGFSCEVVGGMATVCACAAGEEECDCDDESNTKEEWKACRPKPCQLDADCGTDLKCHSYIMECDDVMVPEWDCPEDEPDCKDDRPQVEPCEPTVQGICGPAWLGTCEKANDCGTGFDCAPVEICECHSSAGSPPTIPGDTDSSGDDEDDDGGDSSSGASTDPAPAPDNGGAGKADESEMPDDCDCTLSAQSYCQLIETVCSSDSDCSNEGWTCVEMDDDSAGVCTFDFETGEERCEESEEQMQCVPPGYEQWSEDMDDFAESAPVSLNDDAATNNKESASPGAAENDSSGGCRAGGPVSTGLLPLAVFLMWIMRRRRTFVLE